MTVIFHEKTKTFHLYNDEISYIFTILENGTPGQLYSGERLNDKEDYSELLEMKEGQMHLVHLKAISTFLWNI